MKQPPVNVENLQQQRAPPGGGPQGGPPGGPPQQLHMDIDNKDGPMAQMKGPPPPHENEDPLPASVEYRDEGV